MNIEEWLTRKLKDYEFSDMVIAFILGFLFTNLSLFVHEAGHVIVANLLGCKAGISRLMVYVGASSVEETCSNINLIFIALAGPFAAFLYGLYCWYAGGKDSILRMAGLISFFYSVLPSLAPFIPTSDMGRAISFGFGEGIANLIWLTVSAIIYYLVALEIKDRVKLF